MLAHVIQKELYFIPTEAEFLLDYTTSFLARKEVMTIAAIIKNEDKDSILRLINIIMLAAIVIPW